MNSTRNTREDKYKRTLTVQEKIHTHTHTTDQRKVTGKKHQREMNEVTIS